jgi:hypothetical protein
MHCQSLESIQFESCGNVSIYQVMHNAGSQLKNIIVPCHKCRHSGTVKNMLKIDIGLDISPCFTRS